MLVVHHLETSRSQRILWLLEELGVPYELKLYRRNPATRLAPPELKAVHPLGKSPVITDDGVVVAESGAIIEYLVEKYGATAGGELARLEPPARYGGAPPMPVLDALRGRLADELAGDEAGVHVDPEAADAVLRAADRARLVRQGPAAARRSKPPGIHGIHRGSPFATPLVCGPDLSMADFQMSFAVEALVSRAEGLGDRPSLCEYLARIRARPAYQRAEAKGGPVLMSR